MLREGDEGFVFEDGEWRSVKILSFDWDNFRVLFIGTTRVVYVKKSEVIEYPFTVEKKHET